MNNLLLATGFPTLKTGVSNIIKELFPKDVTIHTVNSVAMIDEALAKAKIKMVVLDFYIFEDIEMRLKIKQLEGIIKKYRSIKILVMYDTKDCSLFKRMYSMGILGIFSKTESIKNFQTCLQKVYKGELYVENEFLMELMHASTQQLMSQMEKQNQIDNAKLTNREKMIAKLLTEGKSNMQICKLLKLHPSTVSSFKHQVFKKLKVTSLIELEKFELIAV